MTTHVTPRAHRHIGILGSKSWEPLSGWYDTPLPRKGEMKVFGRVERQMRRRPSSS